MINKEIFNDIKDLMGEDFEEMVRTYLENSSKHLNQAKESIEKSDVKSIIDSSHMLKSSSAMLGLTTTAQIAEKIEAKANKIQDIKQDNLVPSLASDVEELLQSFEESRAFLEEELAQLS